MSGDRDPLGIFYNLRSFNSPRFPCVHHQSGPNIRGSRFKVNITGGEGGPENQYQRKKDPHTHTPTRTQTRTHTHRHAQQMCSPKAVKEPRARACVKIWVAPNAAVPLVSFYTLSKGTKRKTYVYLYIYTYIYIYMLFYIYIYIPGRFEWVVLPGVDFGYSTTRKHTKPGKSQKKTSSSMRRCSGQIPSSKISPGRD